MSLTWVLVIINVRIREIEEKGEREREQGEYFSMIDCQAVMDFQEDVCTSRGGETRVEWRAERGYVWLALNIQ